MGGSVGVYSSPVPKSEYDKDFYSLFIDNNLLEGHDMMKRDSTACKSFVQYIKGGAWMDNLTKFENIIQVVDENGTGSEKESSTWKKFGYADPSEIPRARSSSMCSSTSQMSSNSSRRSEKLRQKESVVAQVTIPECYSAIDTWTLFMDNAELRGLLFAALYPLYLDSSAYKLWRRPSHWRLSIGSSSSDSAENRSYSSHFASMSISGSPTKKTRRSERLRDLLIGAAALFDGSDLESHPSDPQVRWIEDFKNAISCLPLSVMVAKLSRDRKESKVLYANILKQTAPAMLEDDEFVSGLQLDSGRGSPFGNAVRHSLRASSPQQAAAVGRHGQKVGANLHELLATGCSTDSAKRIEEALFGVKFYKHRHLRTNGEFLLRALKPVFNAQGKYAYTLSIDAVGSWDPQHTGIVDSHYPPEAPFQQVDDVLALLPLLLKC